MVKLINQATKIESEAKTSESGYFTFVNVRPGKLQPVVEVQGFKGAQARFDVGVSETITQNVVLTLGQVSELVEIISAAELVQGSSSELGTVIPRGPCRICR